VLDSACNGLAPAGEFAGEIDSGRARQAK